MATDLEMLSTLQQVAGKFTDCTLLAKNGETVAATRCLVAAVCPKLDARLQKTPPGGKVQVGDYLESAAELQELVRCSLGQSSAHIKGSTSAAASGSNKSRAASLKIGELTAKLNHYLSVFSDKVEQWTAFFGKTSAGEDAPPLSTDPYLQKLDKKKAQQQRLAAQKLLRSKDNTSGADGGDMNQSNTEDEDAIDHDGGKGSMGPLSFLWSYAVLQTVAFAAGILRGQKICWSHAWYYNLERGGLFMDDVMIKRNLNVVDPQFDWDRLLRTDYWGLEMFDPQVWTHKSFRPVTVWSFRFDYQNFGFDSYAFHRHNIILHALAGVLLGYIAHRILKMTPAWAALLSFLFLTHPVHTESLLYIVGRADPQCTDVFLLAVILYERMIRGAAAASTSSQVIHMNMSQQNKQPSSGGARSSSWTAALSVLLSPRTLLLMVLSLLLVTVSGLCKEIGFTVFGLLVLLEGYNVMAPANAKAKKNAQNYTATIMSAEINIKYFAAVVRSGVVIAIGTFVIIWRFQYTQGTKIARMDPYSNPIAAHDNLYQQVISYWYVHGRYAELLVWPRFLNYDYSMNAVPLILSAKDVRLLLPASSYVLLCVAVHFTMHQFHTVLGRASGFGLATFAMSFLPMSNILFPVGTLIAERLLYIYVRMGPPMLHHQRWQSATQVGTQHLALTSSLQYLPPGPVITSRAWGGFYWVRCYLRVFDWKDSETITEVDGLSQPWSGRTSFNIANLYLSRKDYDRALEAYVRSIRSDPEERDSMPLYHAGQIFIYRGDWLSAEQYLKKAVGGYFSPLTLAEEEVFHDYGMALWHVNKAPEAIYNLQASIITNPNFAKGYNNLACAQVVLYGLDLKNQEMINQGLGSLEKALSIAPDMALYWRNAAVLLSFIGDGSASQNAWNKFALYDPSAAVQTVPDNCVWEFYFR
eukprot:g6976.t1